MKKLVFLLIVVLSYALCFAMFAKDNKDLRSSIATTTTKIIKNAKVDGNKHYVDAYKVGNIWVAASDMEDHVLVEFYYKDKKDLDVPVNSKKSYSDEFDPSEYKVMSLWLYPDGSSMINDDCEDYKELASFDPDEPDNEEFNYNIEEIVKLLRITQQTLALR